MFMYSVNNAVAVHACSHEFTRFIWIIWLMFNRTKSVLSWAAVQSACILHADVHVYTGWLKMQDVKMMDQKWRQGQGVKWNAKSILSLFRLKRSPLVCSFVSCYFIPAFSGPAISCPAISCPANWSVNFTSVIFSAPVYTCTICLLFSPI